MAPQFPSIQSFFQAESSSSAVGTSAQIRSVTPGDGFTEEEIDAVLHPKLDVWIPAGEYPEIDIACLDLGPGHVCIQGRIVNFYHQSNFIGARRPRAAQGCIKLLVKDDTGALTVG